MSVNYCMIFLFLVWIISLFYRYGQPKTIDFKSILETSWESSIWWRLWRWWGKWNVFLLNLILLISIINEALLVFQMIELTDGLFVKSAIYDSTLTIAKNSSELSRGMIEGIFKPEFIKLATWTGQTCRAIKKKRHLKPYAFHLGLRKKLFGKFYSISW